jgi:Domain of unknown function (DUF4159)/Aerotolerance regulator N-terminal
MSLGALAFLNPWLLAGLLALPAIYWLLRTVPPRPKQVNFPATRILVGLENKDKTPAKTPWWLTLLRMLAAALVIMALADPVLNPNREAALKGSGPVALVVDNGWAAASKWAERVRMVDRLITEAEGQSRTVIIVPTAFASKTPALRIEPPGAARSTAAALQPQPFAPDRAGAVGALAAIVGSGAKPSIVWLADGIDHDGNTRAFADQLVGIASGSVQILEGAATDAPLGLNAGVGPGGVLQANVIRTGGPIREGFVQAYSVRGQRLGDTPFKLGVGDTTGAATFTLPLELRNQVTRVEIASERSAGAVQLLDARSQWNRIGMLSGESREQAQPLLAQLYFIQKALAPFAELLAPKDSNLTEGLDQVIKQNASVIMLADIGTLEGEAKTKVEAWVKKGGVLVRFAGTRLEKGGDDLLPVTLRMGGRTLGGALSWSTPQPLANFSDDSVFTGLNVPTDVVVNRQVLADPASLGAPVKVWARLKDGTPLVTAKPLGEGQLVLFHATANSDWSNLPLSGLFVDMLRRLTMLGKLSATGANALVDGKADPAAATPTTDAAVLAPLQVLDGFGTLKAPPPTAQAVPASKLGEIAASVDYPPGYYGPQGSPRAHNLIGAKTVLRPLPSLPSGIDRRVYSAQAATPLKPSLLSIALGILFIDVLAVVALQLGSNAWKSWRPAAKTAALVGVGLFAMASVGGESASAQTNQRPGRAQQGPGGGSVGDLFRFGNDPTSSVQVVRPSGLSAADQKALAAIGRVAFGYVLTGDPAVDQTTKAGIMGLNKRLNERTSIDPADPVGLNMATDELAFYPIIYWPVVDTASPLPETTLARIDAFMKQGGLIVFDTRDYGQGMPSGFNIQTKGKEGTALQRLLGRLDIPRLEPVPETHVLTKSFYLLRSFPGRWDGGQLWVEAEAPENSQQGKKAKRSDGVSSILVTANDFASAWALGPTGQPMFPVVPGGEQQREMAIRTGINIAMYALTGNYKADQVHIPDLLLRLGQ